MSAATTADNKTLRDLKSVLQGCVRNLVLDEGINAGALFTFADNFTIPTTSLDDVGDIRRLYLLPSGFYIWDLRVTSGALDTAATPTLVFSVVTTDSSDTVKDTLIASSTIGQSSGTARIANTGVGQYAGGYYLAIKVGTAATTPAAATLGVTMVGSIGVNSYQAAGNYPILTDVTV